MNDPRLPCSGRFFFPPLANPQQPLDKARYQR